MVIGRYQIVQKLGEGGMGMVFLAKDPTLGRSVAIKIISNRAAGESEWLRSRFLQEAKLVALLNHPMIVSIFDLGEHGGQPYIVMEYVAGVSLHALLRQRRLTSAEILGCVRSVAIALDYAHSQNIIHRDIKPANLLIGNTGLKVTDFGVAKLLTGSDNTSTGVVGTLAYMAPEQFKRGVLPQSDQYSLAALTYELLVGHTVFQAESEAEMVFKICNEPVTPFNLVCPEINDAVSRVLGRGLSKDPADRFATCLDFARALELSVKGADAIPTTPSLKPSNLKSAVIPPVFIPSFETEAPRSSGKILLVGTTVSICAGLALFLLPRHQNPQPSPQVSFGPQAYSTLPSNSDNAVRPPVSQPMAATPNSKVRVLDSPKTSTRKGQYAPQHEPAIKQRVASNAQIAVKANSGVDTEQNASRRSKENVNGRSVQNPSVSDQAPGVPLDGRLVWSGTLEAGQQIELGASSGVGVVSGALPGVPVSVEVHPGTVRVVTPPGPDNQWRKIVIQNDNTKRSIVVVRWSVIRR